VINSTLNALITAKVIYQSLQNLISSLANRFWLLIFALLKKKNMKKSIHPNYKEVVFWDTTSDFKFLTKSTNVPKETIVWTDGKEYPVVKVEVSSASHPFFTGKKMFVDTAGRVEKFKNTYQKKTV
jgi:large subunit ribosomal protein L31